jgi:hypothetical protein
LANDFFPGIARPRGCDVRLYACLAASLLAIVVGFAPAADVPMASANDNITVGIMSGMFKGIPQPLIKAGGQQFNTLFKKFTGLPGDVMVEDDYRKLATKVNENKIQLGVIHGYEWAWLAKQNPQLAPLVVTVPAKLPQACIVVNAKNPVLAPANLKGANIDVPFNMKAHGFLYLDKLQKSCPPGSFAVNTPEDLGPEEALDEIVKGKAIAAMVDHSTFAAYKVNNPGKAVRLKLLSTSELFPPTVLVYSKRGLTEKTISQIRTGLLKAHKDPQGKAFLFLWNLKGFEEPSPAFEKLVEDSVKAYPPPAAK